MADKLTTVGQLKRLALRGKADSAAQISELAALVVAGLEDVRHVGVTLTLPAPNWLDRAQTIQHEALLADGSYWYFAYGDIGVNAADIAIDGQITFQCENVPDVDLTVNVIRLEVEADDEPANVGKVFNLTSNEKLKTYIDERISDLAKNFDDFRNALLYDSDNKVILDSEDRGIIAKVVQRIEK